MEETDENKFFLKFLQQKYFKQQISNSGIDQI